MIVPVKWLYVLTCDKIITLILVNFICRAEIILRENIFKEVVHFDFILKITDARLFRKTAFLDSAIKNYIK